MTVQKAILVPANVMYSPWTDVTYDAVTNAAGDTIYYYEATLHCSKLTKKSLIQELLKCT